MIYLIGGPPKCGKTTLSKHLLKEHGIPWISGDTLETVIDAYIKENRKDAFARSYMKGETNDETYAMTTPEEIVQSYVDQAKTTAPAIERFALAEITDGNDYVVEGYHVTPSLAADLIKTYPNQIRALFLIKTDTSKLLDDFHKSTTPNDWILRKTHQPETFIKIAEMIRIYAEWFKKEAEKHGMTIYEMDDDFQQRLKDAAGYLLKS